MHPGRGHELDKGLSIAWSKVPYSLGITPRYRADQEADYVVLNEPDGPFYFAGEHLSHVGAWQEGAILSARRAVNMIDRHRRERHACVLRDVDLDADHVGLHHSKHEGAAGGIGLDQGSDIDVALGHHAIERRDYALIVLLLVQDLQLRFLLLDVGLRDRHRRLLGGERQPIGVALLRGGPALLDQRLVARPVGAAEIAVALAPAAAPP